MSALDDSCQNLDELVCFIQFIRFSDSETFPNRQAEPIDCFVSLFLEMHTLAMKSAFV